MENGEIFDLALMNPSPWSRKTKNGPVYYCKFEIDAETHERFMAMNTTGMIIAARAMVTQDGQFIEPEEVETTEKEKGPYGHIVSAIIKSGFYNAPKLIEFNGAKTLDEFMEWARGYFGVDSLTDVPPWDWVTVARDIGILYALPASVRLWEYKTP